MENIITTFEKENLYREMTNLLDEYDYEWSSYAIGEIIDTWVSEKGELINAFKKHPNYIEGKFMIAFAHDYERPLTNQGAMNFANYLIYSVMCRSEYVEALPTEVNELRQNQHCAWLPREIYDFFSDLWKYAERTISAETAALLSEIAPAIHPHTGEKTSRVINRLCTYLGYHKHSDYNREYAKFADSLSPMVIKRHTILSINPLDYLTMSFGNSWASCHTIDKENKRDMPDSYEGAYSSGTISYMLDSSSMVFYTVDKAYDDNNYWTQPKINRQMFHWGEEKLVQGRLYPQDNDGYSDAYTPYRNIVQEIMSIIFNFPNLWTVSKGTDAASKYVFSEGTHYKDYRNYSNCSLSRPKGSTNEHCFTIGADPICIECGCTHSVSENINCCAGDKRRCNDCGCYIDEEDGHWCGDYFYCEDCCEYCDFCEEWTHSETHYVEGYGDVCGYCLDEYFTYCECCSHYTHNDSIRFIEAYDEYVCDECLAEYYTECAECGEYFRTNDMHEVDDEMLCDKCFEDFIADNEEEVC